jgi:SAM-dependent methyltransferase
MPATLSQHSGYYERYWRPNETWGPSGSGIDPLEQSLIKRLAKAGTVCLDYGFGDGRKHAAWLQEVDVRYNSFDISQAAVQIARTLGLNVRLLTRDGRTTLVDDCCDLASCFEVFEHLQEPQLAIREFAVSSSRAEFSWRACPTPRIGSADLSFYSPVFSIWAVAPLRRGRCRGAALTSDSFRQNCSGDFFGKMASPRLS